MNLPAYPSPPRLPLKLLKWFCRPELIEDVEGDLSELYAMRCEQSKTKARLLFSMEVLLLFRPGIIRNLSIQQGQNQFAMISNYLKIAIRNALRYKGYTALNLLGLVVGIASSMLILMWIDDEVSVNKFHAKGDQIYQLFRNMNQSGGMVNTTPTLPKPVGDLLKNDYSEVEDVVYVSWPMELRIDHEENTLEEQGHFVSPEFFQMFSFELTVGDKNNVLQELDHILISESMAEKLFGAGWKTEAPGQIIKVDESNDVIIDGIFKDVGSNSTVQFDWLLNAQAFFARNDWVENWGNGSFSIVVTIPDETKVATVAERLFPEIRNHTENNPAAGDEDIILQKFSETYLYSKFENGVIAGGRIDFVRIMAVVSLFVLIVACINFMNLTTARSSRRAKEIGLRKVMGAERKGIRMQFYMEAMMLVGFAVILSVGVVLLALPYFNNLVDKSLALQFDQLKTWYFLGGLTLVVGTLSGSYPALLLSSMNVISSIKGGIVKQSGFVAIFRKGLVVFQFALSTLLINGTSVIYKQMDFVLNKDLGLDKDNLLAVRLDGDLRDRIETYKTELMTLPEVTHVSGASGNPLDYGRSTSSASWEGKDPSEGYEVNVLLTDEKFIETSGMEILAGRDFAEQLQDSTNFLINEVAAGLMGFDDPIGKKLSFWGINGKIVGVVKNFHMSNLYEPIAPLIITCISPSTQSNVALIRIDGPASKVVPAIEEVTKTLNPAIEFEYEFIDQAYAEAYQSERTMSTLANIFAGISIFISSLGLLGLASYSAEQRSREIGVRKVHGASVSQILMLLSGTYSKLMVIAFLLAIPVGYYVSDGWLSNFEFRTSLSPMVFIVAGIITFGIGVLTVTAKSYQAATVNPVKSLKQE